MTIIELDTKKSCYIFCKTRAKLCWHLFLPNFAEITTTPRSYIYPWHPQHLSTIFGEYVIFNIHLICLFFMAQWHNFGFICLFNEYRQDNLKLTKLFLKKWLFCFITGLVKISEYSFLNFPWSPLWFLLNQKEFYKQNSLILTNHVIGKMRSTATIFQRDLCKKVDKACRYFLGIGIREKLKILKLKLIIFCFVQSQWK
jgi:hypothetical protein